VRHAFASASQEWEPPELLSEYELFTGNGSTQEPRPGVIPYDLNTPLFSDYTAKYRFLKLPKGASATYHGEDSFAFPIGAVIAKTFAYPNDMRDLSKGQRLIETRILIHRAEGWLGYPYVWNDEQTEAKLRLVGAVRDMRWIHTNGEERTNRYFVPNVNQCMACHENDKVMAPIGPKARHINRSFNYGNEVENQLTHWTKTGVLRGAPSPPDAPRAAVWDDPSTGSLDERARAWLDINCAHCHNPIGPARTSGLDLRPSQTDRYKWGVGKGPVAAGPGTGGRLHDIVPGKPDESILLFRLQSTAPGIMMPELSRRLVDEEGTALIREWIANLNEDPRTK
jgi:uncharacterized repeat protein (TIGR03806 family)